MADNKSAPLILGLAGLAAVFLTSGLTGNSLADIFKGQFGSIPTSTGIPPTAPASSSAPPDTSATAANAGKVSVPAAIQAPSDVPGPIVTMISWCNSVAGQYDYAWGGGHDRIGMPNSGACSSRLGLANSRKTCFGFDCSGAVSGALGAAGFLSAPLVSGDLAHYGSAGPGKYVTIYAN